MQKEGGESDSDDSDSDDGNGSSDGDEDSFAAAVPGSLGAAIAGRVKSLGDALKGAAVDGSEGAGIGVKEVDEIKSFIGKL